MCGGFDLFAHYLFIHNAVTPGERGLPLGILGGICRPVLLIRPLFRTKNCLFHAHCQTWSVKSIPVFISLFLGLERQPKDSLLFWRIFQWLSCDIFQVHAQFCSNEHEVFCFSATHFRSKQDEIKLLMFRLFSRGFYGLSTDQLSWRTSGSRARLSFKWI